MAPRYELAIGLNKGHKTTKIRVARNKSEKEKTVVTRPSRLKGVRSDVFFFLYIKFEVIVYFETLLFLDSI